MRISSDFTQKLLKHKTTNVQFFHFLIQFFWLILFITLHMLSHVQLFNRTPFDRQPTVSSVHGILQARIQEWVAVSSSRGSSQPRGQTYISCLSKWFLYYWATWEAHCLLYLDISLPAFYLFSNLSYQFTLSPLFFFISCPFWINYFYFFTPHPLLPC